MQIARFRSIAALVLASIMLLACTGCWDRKEVNDLNVATLIGFDRATSNGKPEVLLTVLTMKIGATGASGMSGGGAPPTLGQAVSVEGETATDAMRNFTLRSSRQLYLGHILAIVIGEDLARQGIEPVIEFADRDATARYRTQVVVCQGTALDALQVQPEYETLASTELTRTIEQDTQFVSKAVPATLLQVIYDLITPGRDAIMPRMNLFTPPEQGSFVRKGPPAGTVEIEQPNGASKKDATGGVTKEDAGVAQTATPEKKAFNVDGSGVFLGDKLVGWLNGEESKGVLFITGQAHGGAVPFAFRSAEKNASFLFQHLKTEIKPVIAPDGITFEISIRGDGMLSEDNYAAIDATKEEDVRQAQQLIDAEAGRYCQEAAAKCQSLKSDPFGFGDLIHRTNPAYWKQIKDRWPDYFPTVKVQVKADFTIENAGVAKKAVQAQ